MGCDRLPRQSFTTFRGVQLAEAIDQREGWVLLKIPRGDIDGVGEVK